MSQALIKARELKDWCETEGGLNEIFDMVHKAHLHALLATAPSEADARERLFGQLQALKSLRTLIGTIIATAEGRKAEMEIQAQRAAADVRTRA